MLQYPGHGAGVFSLNYNFEKTGENPAGMEPKELMMGSKNLAINFSSVFLLTLFSTSTSFAGDSSVVAAIIKSDNSTPMEGCLLNTGFGNIQAIKNMAQKFGPEAVLDMMFSSVNPVFQPALLTKSGSPAKPVKNIEDMREDKYFQPAIVPVGIPVPWVKITGDGRMISSKPVQTETGFGWMRLPSSQADANEAEERKPAATGIPQRY
jgi:hypothetical protein